MPANARKRMESPPDRRRDDPARYGHDAIPAMVEAIGADRSCLCRGEFDVWPDLRAAFRPPDAEHHLLGDCGPDPWPRPGLANLGSQPSVSVRRLPVSLQAHQALLPGPARLAAGRCPALRVLDRSG